MKQTIPIRRKIIRAGLVLIVLLLVTLYVVYPTALAVVTVIPDNGSVGAPPDGFTSAVLTTEDNIQLGAWYAPPQNGTVILLAHGAGGGRESVTPYATLLRENGFGVLAMNMRGYGDSEGRINRRGWSGTRDVMAAVEFVKGQSADFKIGGFGLSMGGEILLGAASACPEIRAIAADGATFRAVNEYTALPMNLPLYRNFTTGMYSFIVGVLSGEAQPNPQLIESISAAETTSFLFIAAGDDDDEIAFNQLFQETVAERGSLWIVPGVGHTGGYAADPDAYERRIVDFFTATLLA